MTDSASQGIIFVVDSADSKRLELVKAELNGLLLDSQLKVRTVKSLSREGGSLTRARSQDSCLLIFFNKRDLPDALTVEELTAALDFEASCRETNRKFAVQPTIATTGDGLHAGISWLCENMAEL